MSSGQVKAMSTPAVSARTKEALKMEQAHERSWLGVYRLGGVLLIATAVLWNVLGRMAAILYPSGVPG